MMPYNKNKEMTYVKNVFKRLLSLLLVLVLVGSMFPAVYAQDNSVSENEPVVLTDADYAAADSVFAQIDAMENAPVKKNATQAQLSEAAEALALASDNYVEGSLNRNGNTFTWMTDEGIRCIYDPQTRERKSHAEASLDTTPSGIYNEPVAKKDGWPGSNEVYLIGPYYHDSSEPFTDQYKYEAADIAEAIGDTDGYTLYSGTAATVDKVAEALSNGAVVIFDSHGTTDYTNPSDKYDCVTGATSSYLCLSSKTGLTTEDFNNGDALYGGGNEAYVNGTAIAKRMTSDNPAGIVWMAICLGMATDGLYAPLREKGVEVVYGYSQSVSFGGDYLWEEVFWDNMCDGETVATAITQMKSRYGEWDCAPQMYEYGDLTDAEYGSPVTSISEARDYYYAFPIVVSDEDTHPGQRKGSSFYGADSLQTVKSTYTLFSQYEVTALSNNRNYGTVSFSGNTITAVPAEGYFAEGATVLSGNATVSQNGNKFTVKADSDCTVQINFAPKTAVTVSFSGATVASQNGYAGDTMTLPTATAPEGFTFVGWMTAPLSQDITEKPTFYTDSFIPTASMTLYALYSYVEEGSGTGTGDYVKVTSTPDDWSGEYVIVYESGKLILDGSLTTLDAKGNVKSVTITNNTISADAVDRYKFTIAKSGSGYSIQSASGKYIGGTSGSNTLTSNTSAVVNKISLDASGNATIVSNSSTLQYNASDNRFRYYKSANQKAIALYLKDGSVGTTCYTSNPTKCEHTNTAEIAAVAATCIQSGFTAGVQCKDCGSFISGHEPVAALGHSWSDWAQTTAPTCTAAGEQTRTCSRCKATETQAVSATGHSMDNGKITTAPTCTTAGVMTYTCGTCGNVKTETIAATGHNYVLADGVYTCTSCGDSYAAPTEPSGPDDSQSAIQLVENPRVNTAYKLYVEQENLGKTLYFAGTVANKDYYLATTEDLSSATDVYMEEANGGYYLYFYSNGAKTYIDMFKSGTYYNLGLKAAPSAVYSFDADYDTLVAMAADTLCFIGTYDSFNTLSCSKEKYLATNFPAHLGIVGQTEGEPDEDPIDPEIPIEPDEPGYGKYQLVTDITDITSGGQFVITVRQNGAYIALNDTMGAVSVRVADDCVVYDDTVPVWTVGTSGTGITLKSDGQYLAHTSKTNTTLQTTAFTWNLDDGDKTDSFCISSSKDISRAIAYRISTDVFKTYDTSNSSDSDYDFDLYLFKLIKKAEEPKVDEWNITLGDDLKVNFYVDIPAEQLANTQIRVTVAGVTTEYSNLTADSSGHYPITVTLAAAQMTEQITLAFVVDGVQTDAKTYTIRQYADTVLADESKSSCHALVKEMLNYGGMAQTYFGYNTGKLANTGITGVAAADIPAAETEMTVTGKLEGIRFYGASLVYRNKIAVRFYFKVTGDIASCSFGEYTAVQSGTLYYVEVADISPNAWDARIELTVTDTDGNALTVAYSPMDYMVRMNAKGSDSLKALLKAMYNYHLAAKAYTA